MKIIIISDSHGRLHNIARVLEREGRPDLMIHLGDSQGTENEIREMAGCQVYMVAGNCDFFTRLPGTCTVLLGEEKAMLTHGHQYFVSAGLTELKRNALASDCSIVMYGHTHCPMIDRSDPELTVLNPGSIELPRQKGKQPSYLVMELQQDGEKQMEIRYL